MALIDQINEDIKTAMKNKEQGALRALRAVKSALLLLQSEEGRKEISGQEEIKVIQKLVKQRKESVEIYTKQSRADLAQLENEELIVLEKFLPAQMTAEELKAIISQVIAETAAVSSADFGKVMNLSMAKIGSAADGKTISGIVKELLNKQ